MMGAVVVKRLTQSKNNTLKGEIFANFANFEENRENKSQKTYYFVLLWK